jgi:hypothetical protein
VQGYELRRTLARSVQRNNPKVSFHGQLATGPINNPLTNNQDFSSNVVRHPFFINEVWIDYHPNEAIQLQGGRVQEAFADNSRFLFDDDVRFNRFNEKYIFSFKKAPAGITSLELRAGQYIFSNPNVAIVTAGSPLAQAGAEIGSTGRSANLFHQGLLINQQFNKKFSQQIGGDVQLYRNPNQIQLASTANGVVLIVQPGLGLTPSGQSPVLAMQRRLRAAQSTRLRWSQRRSRAFGNSRLHRREREPGEHQAGFKARD